MFRVGPFPKPSAVVSSSSHPEAGGAANHQATVAMYLAGVFRVQGLGFRGLGFRVQGLGFRGLGFRV